MKLPDSKGGTNHIVPFSNGALRPPHVKQIGPAFPLFLLYEDKVTKGEGKDGIVLGGRPVTDGELAKELGVHPRTVAEHRLRLQKFGYIAAMRTGRGYIVRVRKSKKWLWLQQVGRLKGFSTAGEHRVDKIQPNGSNARSAASTGTANQVYPKQPNGAIRPSQTAESRSDNPEDSNEDVKLRAPSPIAFQGRCLRIGLEEDQSLHDAFPDIDRRAEYRKMDAWLIANPARRKKNHARFAFNWLSSAVEWTTESQAVPSEPSLPKVRFRETGEPYHV